MLQNIIRLSFLASLIVFMTSCGAKKQAVTESVSLLPKIDERVLINRLDSLHQQRPDYFYSKLSVKYSSSEQNFSFKTSIRATADSALQATITFANIPIYNSIVTPDTLTLVDRRNNCFIHESTSYFKQLFNVNFQHKNIEELLLGMPVSWDDELTYSQIEDPYNYIISSYTDKAKRASYTNDDLIIQYHLDDQGEELEKVIIESPMDTTSIIVNYYERELIEGYNIPTKGKVKIITSKDELNIEFKYNKSSINDPRVLYLAIPPSYEKCN